MEQGWVKLHRKLLENPIVRKPNYLALWVVLLLKANHKDNKMIWNGGLIVVKEGQLLTGRKELSKETGIPEGTIEGILTAMEKNQHLIQQQKTTKYRIITILNWKNYQNSNIKTNNKPTTNQQQTDTNKNDKNVKNDKKEEAETSSAEIPLLIKEFEAINPAVKRMYGNKTQRKACSDLIESYGFDRVLNVIKNTLPRTNKMTAQFFPNIGTPLQLFDKWQKLEDAIFAYRAKKQIKNNNVFW